MLEVGGSNSLGPSKSLSFCFHLIIIFLFTERSLVVPNSQSLHLVDTIA